MLALEFMLVSGTDWFQLPLRLPYGVACRVRSCQSAIALA